MHLSPGGSFGQRAVSNCCPLNVFSGEDQSVDMGHARHPFFTTCSAMQCHAMLMLFVAVQCQLLLLQCNCSPAAKILVPAIACFPGLASQKAVLQLHYEFVLCTVHCIYYSFQRLCTKISNCNSSHCHFAIYEYIGPHTMCQVVTCMIKQNMYVYSSNKDRRHFSRALHVDAEPFFDLD